MAKTTSGKRARKTVKTVNAGEPVEPVEGVETSEHAMSCPISRNVIRESVAKYLPFFSQSPISTQSLNTLVRRVIEENRIATLDKSSLIGMLDRAGVLDENHAIKTFDTMVGERIAFLTKDADLSLYESFVQEEQAVRAGEC